MKANGTIVTDIPEEKIGFANMNGKNDSLVSQPLVSIIIPCMNEEKTIGVCIKKALSALDREGYEGEIIIPDNSTDNSRDIAMKLGAKVVIPCNKGYGNAFLEGFRHAKGKYVLLADADDTYDLTNIQKFLEPLMADETDFVMGTRLKGHIEKGSMPWLHRYIGNPIITSTLNDLFKTNLSDSQCGMRSITRKAYDKLDLKSEGMEFASEMIIEAARKKLRITEVPITYYPRLTPSKLHSWGDGWRHLRFMMLYNPTPFFSIPGFLVLVLGIFMTLTLAIRGNIQTRSLHSFILGEMLLLIGTQMIATGGYMKVYGIIHNRIDKTGLTSKFLDYHSLEFGLIFGFILFFAGLVLGTGVILKWINSGYGSLSEVGTAVTSMTMAALGIQVIFSTLIISIFLLEEKDIQ